MSFFTGLFDKFNKPEDKQTGIINPRSRLDESPYVGEISIFAFGFAPLGWRLCDGSALVTTSFAALYSLIGFKYGGSGNSFNLPDFRGRVPIGYSPTYTIGSKSGVETVTLTTANLPSHNHLINCNTNEGTSASPVGNFLAVDGEGIQSFINTANAGNVSLGYTGNDTGHNNMMPFLTLAYYIAVSGLYPPRP